jgi:anti-sigma regulatory factor (Ser/Thr protein kinase)
MCETRTGHLVTSLEFAALPSAVPCARLHARAICHEWSLGEIVDTIELITSELVTNAIEASAQAARQLTYQRRAGLPTVALHLFITARNQMLIEVWDDVEIAPHRRATRLHDESGRGLALVDALASSWGCYVPEHGGGKVVWATVQVPQSSTSTRGDGRGRYLV